MFVIILQEEIDEVRPDIRLLVESKHSRKKEIKRTNRHKNKVNEK